MGGRAAAILVSVVLIGIVQILPADQPHDTPPPASVAWTLEPYTGLGAWIDVYDWANAFTNGKPPVVVADIDRMAAAGIQTIFIQTGHERAPADELEPDRLHALIERAHANDMAVVAWYLPGLVDPAKDLRRLLVGARAGVDGLAVDIESLAVANVIDRNERLLALSAELREAMGDKVIGAITPSAVQLQVVNTAFWPAFPWPELAATYDTILPMAYWSIRIGDLRAGERYIGENIERVRASTGKPDLPIHPVGGIADATTVADLQGMVKAMTDGGAIGGSLYDWHTSTPEQWAALAPLRKLRT